MEKDYTWNLSPLFKSDNDPEIPKYQALVEEKTAEFVQKWKTNDKYLKDPKTMLEALDEYENWARNYGLYNRLGYYLHLRSAQDQEDVNIKAQNNKYTDRAQKLENDMRFFTHTIAMMPKGDQPKFLDSPALSKYKHFLKREFDSAKYLLSEAEENILSLKSPSSHSNWVDMVSEFLSREEALIENESGEKIKVSYAELQSKVRDKHKNVRDSAAKAFNKILSKHVDVAEHEINSILQSKKVNDDLRKFSRPDEGRLHDDDIDASIIDALIEATTEKFDIPARYYKLKATLMGVKKLQYHERNVPYTSVEKNFTFEEATELVDKSLSSIDPEFVEIFRSYIKNGQFDVFPRKGKDGGAFCSHNTTIEPTYILLNHTNKLQDVLTLAHEVGHGINNELVKKSQHELYFGNSLAIAEVASTFMEDFVLEELVKESDKEEQLSLMISKLDDDMSTIFRQVACYKFEKDLHAAYREKGYLSKKDIGEIFARNMAAYMGDYVEQSTGSENWWVYWPHIRYFFYVYSYASGLLISKSMQNSFKKDKEFIVNVKRLLSAGTSDSPKDIFAKMGIDITDKNFWINGLDEVGALLEKTEKLAKELGKI